MGEDGRVGGLEGDGTVSMVVGGCWLVPGRLVVMADMVVGMWELGMVEALGISMSSGTDGREWLCTVVLFFLGSA